MGCVSIVLEIFWQGTFRGGRNAVVENLGGDNVYIWCVYITIVDNEIDFNGPWNATMNIFLGTIVCAYVEVCGNTSLRE